MTTIEIAETILEQLGGTRALAIMVGARDFAALTEGPGVLGGVQFKIGGGARDRINRVRVELNTSDTYTVRYFKGAGVNVREVGEPEVGVYAETLRAVVEERTGFVLTVPTIRRAVRS